MLQTRPIYLLTIDLSMFGEGAAGAAGAPGTAAAPAGDGSAPAEAAPAEVRYGKQPEQTAAPQQTQTPEQQPDKGKQWKDLINGEFKQEFADATQKIINRRFKESDAKIQAMQPVIDLLDQRYGTGGDMTKLMSAIENDRAYWQDAADQAGMTVEQYQKMQQLERQNRQYLAMQQQTQAQFLAQRRYQQWQAEAEALKQKYPDFDLDEMQGNELFMLLLKNNYPMENAYKAAAADKLAAQAAANTEKAVTDNIKARGNRPAEAGANATPAFVVKDDVSKLTASDVKDILRRIGNRERVTFG